jgi:MoaA/NifB/PqqE/SkfB family radical SAM enzyme
MDKRILKARLAYNLSLLKSKFIPIPLLVKTILTRRCNLDCSYCGAIKNPAKKELSLDEWKKCADILYSMGNRHVNICGGGEPLMREDLCEFISYVSKRPVATSIMLNGTLLDENKIIKLGKSGIMDIGINTNTLPIENGLVDLKIFDLLKKHKHQYGYELTANVLMTRKNFKKVPSLLKQLIEKDLFVNLYTIASGKNYWYRGYSPENMFKVSDKNKLKKILLSILNIKKRNKKNIMQSMAYLNKILDFAYNSFDWSCDAGMYYLCINDDGYVMQCEDVKPTEVYYKDLKKKYPMKIEGCKGCFWACNYSESNKRRNLVKHYLGLIKFLPKIVTK